MREKSRPTAYQRDVQLRVTGKTEAGGINFLTHGTPLLSFRVANRNIDMAGLLVDAGAAALSAGSETAQRSSFST